MTTKALIVNHGPEYMVARIYSKGARGEPMRCTHSELIGPQTHAEFFVHGAILIVLDESDEQGNIAVPDLPRT